MRTFFLLLLVTGFFAGLAACDGGFPATTPPSPPRPLQTRVVRITLDPDTVAARDTVLIRAVIEDSLDTSFRFYWSNLNARWLPYGGDLYGPRIYYVAPRVSADSGRVVPIGIDLTVSNGTPGTRPVSHYFLIPVRN